MDKACEMELLSSCMGMVRAVAKAYGGGEDLIQDGVEGVLRALRNFDPEKGPFKPYARLYVVKAISRAKGPFVCGDMTDVCSDDRSVGRFEVRDAVGRLPERERVFVSLYYGLDGVQMTTSEIAVSRRVSEECVRQVICRARRRLRDMLL